MSVFSCLRPPCGRHAFPDGALRRDRGPNLVGYHIGALWDRRARRFSDGAGAFVPNKAATIIEALCRLAAFTGDDNRVERFVGPTADSIVAHQARRSGSGTDGAISQATISDRRVDQLFPYYIARCIPGLVAAYQALDQVRYLEAALAAALFLERVREDDGSYPQVVYPDGRKNRYPRWVAAVGDIIRVPSFSGPWVSTSMSTPRPVGCLTASCQQAASASRRGSLPIHGSVSLRTT